MKRMAVCMAIVISIIQPGGMIYGQQNKDYHKNIYFSFSSGVGFVDQNFLEGSSSNPHFSLGMHMGYFVAPWLEMGGSVSGWLYQADNYYDWTKGIGISDAVLQAQVYPIKNIGLYGGFGYGFSFYYNRNPSSPVSSSNGEAFVWKLGYEHQLDKSRVFAGAFIAYHTGDFNDDMRMGWVGKEYNVWEVHLVIGMN